MHGPRGEGFQGGPSGVDFSCFSWAVLEGQNWKRIFEKTRVGFGRTELSLMLSCTDFCALSSGHGPRGLGFQGGGEGVDFHVFRGGPTIREKNRFKLLGKNWDRIFEKTRVGFGRTELSLRATGTTFCALSSWHGPRGQGFEGFCKT